MTKKEVGRFYSHPDIGFEVRLDRTRDFLRKALAAFMRGDSDRVRENRIKLKEMGIDPEIALLLLETRNFSSEEEKEMEKRTKENIN